MWPVTSEQGEKGDHGPVWKSMYTACSTQLTTGLACTLSLTREYMEHGGHLPTNYALTVYYLPVYPPYSDSNYGLCRIISFLWRHKLTPGYALCCQTIYAHYVWKLTDQMIDVVTFYLKISVQILYKYILVQYQCTAIFVLYCISMSKLLLSLSL